MVVLDEQSTIRFHNGLLFAQYLIVLKEVLSKVNQDLAIDPNLVTTLKNQSTPQARLFNWNLLCNELDVSFHYYFSTDNFLNIENWYYY